MAEVRRSNRALQDLDAIGAYIEQSSPQYARWLVARLYEAGGTLEDFPLLGQMVPEVQSQHIRERIRDGHRIVYVVSHDDVEVLAVLHGRQDLGKKLRKA